MKLQKIGLLLIFIGIAVVFFALGMPVSVEFSKVVNINLINERQNTLIIGGLLFVSGIVLFAASELKKSTHEPETELHSRKRKVDALLEHYSLSHTHPVNELIHYIAIPAIMLSLAGLMFAIHPAVVLVFFGASLVYYARLSWPFTICMLLGTSVLLTIVDALNQRGILVTASVVIFVVAWIFQFIGHHLEGKKPSFFEDIQYLWVGPLFVLSKLFTRLGLHW